MNVMTMTIVIMIYRTVTIVTMNMTTIMTTIMINMMTTMMMIRATVEESSRWYLWVLRLRC